MKKKETAARRPSIAIIGAGRLGSALGLALAACGYHITAVVARRAPHAARLAALLEPRPPALAATRLRLLPPSDLLLITTPDDAIAATAARLAEAVRLVPRRKRPRLALHTSGALTSDALNALRDAGLSVGSAHPLVSVSDPLVGAESLRHAFYCIEGDRQAMIGARHLVRDLGGESFSISTRHKALYHAAAVLVSGHTVALFDIATKLLVRCGLTEKRASRVLLPLLKSTLENLSAQKPSRALTGTFARADVGTVRRHLAALRAQRARDALLIYALLGRRALQLAAENGADATLLREIARALNGIEERNIEF